MYAFAKYLFAALATLFITPAFAQFGAYDPDLAGYAHDAPGNSFNLISPRLVLACSHSAAPTGTRIVFANGQVATIVAVLNNTHNNDAPPGGVASSDLRLYVLDREMPTSMVMPMWQTLPSFLTSSGFLPNNSRLKRAGFHAASDWAEFYSAASFLQRYTSDPARDLYVADAVVALGGFSGVFSPSVVGGDTIYHYSQSTPPPVQYTGTIPYRMIGYSGSPFMVYDPATARFKLIGTTSLNTGAGVSVVGSYTQDWITWATTQSVPVDGGVQGQWVTSTPHDFQGAYAEKVYDSDLAEDVIATHATTGDSKFYKVPYFNSIGAPRAAPSAGHGANRLRFKVKGTNATGRIVIQVLGNAGRPFTLVYRLNSPDATGSAGLLHTFNLSTGTGANANVADGQWHTIERDLLADTAPYIVNPALTDGAVPDNAFDSAINFTVQGANLRVADVELLPVTPPASGLFGHWRMNETWWYPDQPAQVRDEGDYRRHGKPVGSAHPSGGVGQFDGTDDYIDIGVTETFTELSMAAWVKVYALTSDGDPVFGSMNDLSSTLSVQPNGQIDLALGGWTDGANAIRDAGAVTVGQWTHVAVTWKAGQGFVSYINGKKIKTVGTTLTSWTWPNLIIGARRPLFPIAWFGGSIDEAVVYKRALSEAEMSTLYTDSRRIGFWKLDESGWTGTPREVADASGNLNHGTVVGNPQTAVSPHGRAGVFDGVDDAIVTPITRTLSALTISAWINPANAGSYPIVSSNTDLSMSFGIANGRLDLGLGGWTDGVNSIRDAGENIPAGQWTHVAVTWIGGTSFTVYVNGIKKKTTTSVITSVTWPQLVIGARRPLNVPVDWFNGRIDEVGMWDRVLSSAEIKELAGATDSPIAHWKMDESAWTGAASEVQDHALDNHGTAHGGATTTTGHTGRAGHFDGVDDWVSTGTTFEANALTVAAWIKATPSPTGNPIIGSYLDQDFIFLVDEIGQLEMALGGWVEGSNSIQQGGAVTPGVWTHVAATWHPTYGFKTYVNGVLTDTGATTLSQITWSNLTLGARRPAYPVAWMNGDIDDAYVFDRELSATEIAALMNGN